MFKTNCENCLNQEFCKYREATTSDSTKAAVEDAALPPNIYLACVYFYDKNFMSHMFTSLGDVSKTPPTYMGQTLNWSTQSSNSANVKSY